MQQCWFGQTHAVSAEGGRGGYTPLYAVIGDYRDFSGNLLNFHNARSLVDRDFSVYFSSDGTRNSRSTLRHNILQRAEEFIERVKLSMERLLLTVVTPEYMELPRMQSMSHGSA